VKLKKLSGGSYGWEITVASTGSSPDALHAAKETAVLISTALEAEFAKSQVEPDQVPF
jgi:hypothetical protein